MKHANPNAIRLGTLLLAASLSLMTACGGGSGSSGSAVAPAAPTPTGPTPSSGTTTALVNVSDSPSDRVVTFELTIESIALISSDGSQVTLQSSPGRVEITRIAASAVPFVITSIPQGTYTGATLVVSAPDVVYIDNTGNPVKRQDPSSRSTVTSTFAPALQVGAQPVVLTVDFDVHQTLLIDPVRATVTMKPVLSIAHSNVAANQDAQTIEDGAFESVVGQVTALSANSFTISVSGSDCTMTFNTSSATKFDHDTAAGGVVINDIVQVEGRTSADGSVLATEVEIVSANGTVVEGVVSAASGSPVTSFEVVVQDGSGSGGNSIQTGSTATAKVPPGTDFRVDAGNINLSGLTLPTFSAASLSSGQQVEAESDGAVVNGAFTATSVKLQQQALVGSISAVSGAQFTLTLPDDSAFSLLTGKSTFHVLEQQNTELVNGVVMSPGATLLVRGLIFFDPAQGVFTMVAGRISVP
jgi:Domain of unknown function (DUF5666)/Domain of unknown function (DUF4382)